MASRPTHELMVRAGEYQDRNGETKVRWKSVGTMFTRDDSGGLSIKIDSLPLPIGSWDGWISVFRRDKGGRGDGKPGNPVAQEFDDDIPIPF